MQSNYKLNYDTSEIDNLMAIAKLYGATILHRNDDKQFTYIQMGRLQLIVLDDLYTPGRVHLVLNNKPISIETAYEALHSRGST